MHFQSFNQAGENQVLEFIRQNNFGCLITCHQNQWHASHLMFMPEDENPSGSFISHLASENPQKLHVEQGAEGTIVFSGAHCYISPRHYSSRVSVPTWNYMAVYVYGCCELLPDHQKMELISQLVAHHEPDYFEGAFKELPQNYLDKMLPQFTAFRFRVSRMEHRFKLSQEKPESDRQRIIKHLKSTGNTNDAEIADAMLKLGLKVI
jgi:transcriptional regulator